MKSMHPTTVTLKHWMDMGVYSIGWRMNEHGQPERTSYVFAAGMF